MPAHYNYITIHVYICTPIDCHECSEKLRVAFEARGLCVHHAEQLHHPGDGEGKMATLPSLKHTEVDVKTPRLAGRKEIY